MQKILSVIVLTFVVVFGTAVPAFAATFDVTAVSANGGGGRVKGELSFGSAKTFSYNGYVQDFCNNSGAGDGLGVEAAFFITVMAGPPGQYTSVKGEDKNGCGGFVETFSGNVSWPQNINCVQVVARLVDNGQEVSSFPSSCKDNRFT